MLPLLLWYHWLNIDAVMINDDIAIGSNTLTCQAIFPCNITQWCSAPISISRGSSFSRGHPILWDILYYRTSFIKGHPTLHKSLHLIQGKMLDPIYTWPSSLETCSEKIKSVTEYLSVWTDGITIQRRQFCTWPSSLPSHLKVLKLPTNCPTGGTSHPTC